MQFHFPKRDVLSYGAKGQLAIKGCIQMANTIALAIERFKYNYISTKIHNENLYCALTIVVVTES